MYEMARQIRQGAALTLKLRTRQLDSLAILLTAHDAQGTAFVYRLLRQTYTQAHTGTHRQTDTLILTRLHHWR